MCGKVKATGRAETGFTLFELLVVIALIGIILSVAMLSIGDGGRTDNIRQEARSLAAKLNLLADEAVLNSSEFGVQVTAEEYRFLRYSGDAWVAMTDDTVLHTRQLPGGMRLTLFVDGLDVDLSGNEEKGKASSGKPDIVFFSSAERTPFVLEISYSDPPRLRQRIEGGMLGKVRVVSDAELP